MLERFYFVDSHGNEPFVRASDYEGLLRRVEEAVKDAQIRIGASTNCYNEPKEAQGAADYVARAALTALASTA